MANVIVGHHFWDRPGGCELVCSAAAHALDKLGFNPILTSLSPFDRAKYNEWFGINLQKYDVLPFMRFRLRALGIYMRLLAWMPMKKAINKFNPEIVFTDVNTYKPIEDLIKSKTLTFIEYIHFPTEVWILEGFRGSGLYHSEDPYILERYSRFPLNIYWRGYVKLLPRYLRKNPFETASLVLANSKWTAELSKHVYGDEPKVLNPPIPPNVEVIERPKDFSERENIVVMLGRFSEEKRYHWIVEKVVPRLVKEFGDTKLYLFGGARTRMSIAYIDRVEGLAKRRGFKVSRDVSKKADIYLVPDASRHIINSVMDRAKVFLHATINEHWGIAPTEAMARGLPIVIHRSGGTWSDLAGKGEYGLGYNNEEEAIESITKLFTNRKIWSYYSSKLILRVKELTLHKFIEKFREILRLE